MEIRVTEDFLQGGMLEHILDRGIESLLSRSFLDQLCSNFSQCTGFNLFLCSVPEYKIITGNAVLKCSELFPEDGGRADVCRTCKYETARLVLESEDISLIRFCPQGLRTAAARIVVRGRALATLHVGPFFFPEDSTSTAELNVASCGGSRKQFSRVKKTDVRVVEAALRLVAETISLAAGKAVDSGIGSYYATKTEEYVVAEREAKFQIRASLEQLEAIFTNSQIGIALIDKNRDLVRCNRRMAEILGYDDPESIVGRSLRAVYASEDEYRRFGENYTRVFSKGGQLQQEYQLHKKDGSTVWCSFSGKAIDAGEPPDLEKGSLWVVDDISDKKSMQDRLISSLVQLETVFTNSQVGIMHLQGGRVLNRANQRLADILGYGTPEEMVGIHTRQLHLTQERFAEFGRLFYETLVSGENLHVEYQLRRKDGSSVWCSLSGKALDLNSPPDLNKGVLWMVDDLTKRKELEERLQQLASTDPLTGALNRRAFLNAGEHDFSLCLRNEWPFSFLMLDIDFFKSVNDVYSHIGGDAALVHFIRTVETELRSTDIVGRFGGEEFIIALPGTDLEHAMTVAERIRQCVAESPVCLADYEPFHLTVSIGVASSTALSTYDSLMKDADHALYKAKSSGRNKVCCYLKPDC